VATSEPVVACPTDETLVAFAQRALTPDERDGVASHLDSCESCRVAVRAGAIGSPPPTLGPYDETALPLRLGARIGRYELKRLLGVGGMGHVYVAYDGELDREVALKVLRPELAGSPAVLAERLVRESRLTAKVAHPAVMTVHDVGRDGDVVFIAMELIRGETLGAYVARTEPGWRAITILFERAAQGLAAAHAAGIVHRDFKPENVLVETAGERRVIVTDFGIARATDLEELASGGEATHDLRLTATGAAIGTPAYMAPEQLAGDPVDARSDVFAFAVSLWEALFGARPFPGTTIDQIRTAMQRAPKPTRSVPRRLVRAVERGLAIDPAARWQDLPSFTRELAAVRARRRRVQLAAAGTGLVGAGIAGSLALASPHVEHPCAAGFAALTYNHEAVARALASDPKAAAAVLAHLDQAALVYRVTHAETCRAAFAPAQAPATAQCLEARRIELDGVADDIVLDGPGHALAMAPLVNLADACTRPPPSALYSHVPEDRALRRKVTDLRYRAFDAEAVRNAGDFEKAIALTEQLVPEAEKLWPLVAAETLYLLGATQSQGSDPKTAIATLRKAAALAEASHHDYIAAATWTQLVFSATGDEGDPQRGLEYAAYANAALDRMARPLNADALYHYAYGATLVDAHRPAEAEIALRRAIELSAKGAPDYLPQAIQGLGYLYESQGKFGDAVKAYRQALAELPPTGSGVISALVMIKGRLASNLSLIGETTEAVKVAREGSELADQKLGRDNLDRAIAHSNLAQALDDDGQHDAALAELAGAGEVVMRISGERSERYAEVLMLQGQLLSQDDRAKEALPKLERACDLLASEHVEEGVHAQCQIAQAQALALVGRGREALAIVAKAVPVIESSFGAGHPELANAIETRGTIRVHADQRAEGIADLARAVDLFDQAQIDEGHRAAARFELARALWTTARPKARTLLEAARVKFAKSSPQWAAEREDLEEWLATDGHPRHKLHGTL